MRGCSLHILSVCIHLNIHILLKHTTQAVFQSFLVVVPIYVQHLSQILLQPAFTLRHTLESNLDNALSRDSRSPALRTPHSAFLFRLRDSPPHLNLNPFTTRTLQNMRTVAVGTHAVCSPILGPNTAIHAPDQTPCTPHSALHTPHLTPVRRLRSTHSAFPARIPHSSPPPHPWDA